jgi:hypothetical protein
MNTDFSKYEDIIDSFRGKVNKVGFDTQFDLSTHNLAKTEKFILKMELKRLAGECSRSIDLRGLVNGVCKLFEYDGQSHFLDDVAIRVFEANIAEYEVYTFGVYEAVKNTKNNFRVIYKNEQLGNIRGSDEPLKKTQEKLQYPASLYNFDNYYDRFEERMNFAIEIIVTLENQQQLDATSADISITGCKFRLTNEVSLQIGEIITIQFSGLQREFKFSAKDIFTFEVKNVFRDSNTQLIGCQETKVKNKDTFKKFLSNYIQGNKRRYKINIENTVVALQARSIEQYILPKLSELPVFIEKNERGFIPRHALTTNNNQMIYQYWQNEMGISTLPSLLNEKRLERLQKKPGKSLLVYSFIHQSQGKSFFYSIDTEQLLEEAELSSSFLSLAANQKTFSITELSCVNIDVNSAHSPFVLANTNVLKEQFINLPPSDEIKASLALIPLMVIVNDITHPSLVTQYQQGFSKKIASSKLKQYGHKRTKKASLVDMLGVSYNNQRQEMRFIYDTPIVIQCEKGQWQGHSNDFSISGLQMELSKPGMLSKGDIVYLTFPKLQKITSTFTLKQLPYEVIRINKKKTILNLHVHIKSHRHVGRTFFKLLIDKNRHKLTSDEYAMLTWNLAEALRTSYAKNMNPSILVIQTSGSRYKVKSIVSNNDSSEFLKQMKRLSDRESYYNLYPLVTKLQASGLLEQHLKTLSVDDDPITELLYIGIDPNDDRVDKSIQVGLDSDFSSPESKRVFIKNLLKRGQFYCFKFMISRTNKPDMEYLNAELSYISLYAIHRAKKLEQDILSVVGIIQYFDITEEVLSSYDLSRMYASKN